MSDQLGLDFGKGTILVAGLDEVGRGPWRGRWSPRR